MLHTIEDVLESLTGLSSHSVSIEIEKEEFTIINSIARQVFRGTALTDRQYNLMKEKLQKYLSLLEDAGFENVSNALENLRNPLREIDRSKYITLVDAPENMTGEIDTFTKYIKVRFPFKKSDIMLINEMTNNEGYSHDKGSHAHYFAFNETNLLDIGIRFFCKEFVIDDILKEKYEQIKNILINKSKYLPYVENNNIINIPDKLNKIIQQETNNDFLKIYDRRFRYCLDDINIDVDKDSIEGSIVTREGITYHSKPSMHSISNILHALYNLDRFPLLVVLDKDTEIQLHESVNFFRDLIPSHKQSVLFRDEDPDSGVNQLIKDRKLNNWVDKDTKVVYINNKLPKVLLEADWKPICTFAYNSNNHKHVQMYINNNCDLVVYREETLSPFLRYAR